MVSIWKNVKILSSGKGTNSQLIGKGFLIRENSIHSQMLRKKYNTEEYGQLCCHGNPETANYSRGIKCKKKTPPRNPCIIRC